MTLLQKIVSEKDEIWREENNVIKLRMSKGAEYNDEDVRRQFASYASLGAGPENKVLLIADTRADFLMTKEAKDLSAKEAKHYFIAVAIVSNSMATRLLVNFLTTFYKFDVPIKMFTNETAALKWLQEKESSAVA